MGGVSLKKHNACAAFIDQRSGDCAAHGQYNLLVMTAVVRSSASDKSIASDNSTVSVGVFAVLS